ncbi:M15 family metallopeptidase [Streptomyces sp. NPDC051776]|uniref:M15 family metallopeptidase n=1 Tax=Streptomyces sp. NPDC051776 TaxID=3155414 RepID=UPI0034322CE5
MTDVNNGSTADRLISGPTRAVGEVKALAEFVAVSDIAPTILHDVRYCVGGNFIGRPVNGYPERLCILTRPAAEALKAVQSELWANGYTLKVYDGYRPQRAVDEFVAWAKDLDDQPMKVEYYPGVDKGQLFTDGYIAEKSGHSRGSTVDLTIAEYGEETGEWESLDMGTDFDFFDVLSHTMNPEVGGQQRRNRLLLKTVMEAAGFVNLPVEWWHYTLQSEPYPDTYFDFPVARGALTQQNGSSKSPRPVVRQTTHSTSYGNTREKAAVSRPRPLRPSV